jgi:hypothetical protein
LRRWITAIVADPSTTRACIERAGYRRRCTSDCEADEEAAEVVPITLEAALRSQRRAPLDAAEVAFEPAHESHGLGVSRRRSVHQFRLAGSVFIGGRCGHRVAGILRKIKLLMILSWTIITTTASSTFTVRVAPTRRIVEFVNHVRRIGVIGDEIVYDAIIGGRLAGAGLVSVDGAVPIGLGSVGRDERSSRCRCHRSNTDPA